MNITNKVLLKTCSLQHGDIEDTLSMRHNPIPWFSATLIILTTIIYLHFFNNIAYAEDLSLSWTYNRTGAGIFYVQSKEDDPITITGYEVNRGNTKTIEEQYGQKFNKVKLKFGQKAKLFSVPDYSSVIEVIVFTNRGPFKWSLDHYK